MDTLSEKSLNPGGSSGGSHETHEGSGHERHPRESDNVISLALSTNRQERAIAARHPVENNHAPLPSPYEANKEAAKSVIEENFALSEDASNPGLKGVRLEEPSVAVHVPSFSFLDTIDKQQELERLAANVQSVQREEAAVRLPRAAQLPPVSGVAPVTDGIRPSLEPEYLFRSRRGPRTMIKIVVLIVSIFTVPIAYYLWMGSWNPMARAPIEWTSFDSKSIMVPRISSSGDILPAPGPSSQDIMPPPRRSSEEHTTTAKGGDFGMAEGEPRTAKSSPGEIVATLQPGTPSAQDLPSSTAARPLDLPKPSNQQERDVSRDDDSRTPAKAELRTPKSSAGDTVTMLQPAAQDPPSRPVLRALDSEQIKLLMKQGEQFIAAGDVVTARIAFQRVAEAGDAKATVALGATYDPTALAKLGVVGINADVAKARSWYQRAEKLGSPEAKQRLEVLANR